MENLARVKEGQAPSSLIQGRVRGTRESFYWVETAAGIHASKRAASCLVEPQVSDLVLVYEGDRGGWYVLAVLEKEEGVASSIVFEDGLSLEVRKGRLDLVAEGIHLAGKEIALSSAGIRIDSLKGKVRIMDLSFLGKTLTSQIQRIKSVAEFCDSAVGRLSQRVMRSYRWIQDFEQTRAGRITCLVKDTLFMKGKRASLMAEKKIKMDAEKIHLG
ncbi:MAG: DUF3540 domain-containing protein [Deltaproteobacteria bacterium]|nr:DUF3540 domain-containing protein [Deltaproteobacteria bacterium]